MMHLFSDQTAAYLYEYMELISQYLFTGDDASNRKKELYDHIYKEAVNNLKHLISKIEQLGNKSYS